MPDNLKLVSLGSGNLACHLLPALKNIGCHIVQVYSRNLHHANALAHQLDSEAINRLDHLVQDADIYLIMLKDDVLENVISDLPKLNPDSVVAHTSGATSINILSGLTDNYGSFYPLQSFKKDQETNLGQVPILVNGNNIHTTRQLRILARKLSSKISECSDSDRLKYHLAAVFVNNFTNHMACIVQEFLSDNNLDPGFLDVITQTTFDKIMNHQACSSQTGPAIREDYNLMGKHLELLSAEPNMAHIYKVLSDSIIQKSKTKKDENSGRMEPQ